MKITHSAKRKTTRHFLLLQGPQGPFFKSLSKKLEDENCKVSKINFTSTDRFFYGADAFDYTYSESQWPSYVSDIAKMRGVTDLVVFDDTTKLHSDAIAKLKNDGVNIHVFNHGYFDDEHITLENGGFNANSNMPREPMFYMRTPTIHSDLKTKKFTAKPLMKDFYEICSAVLSKKLESRFLPFAGINYLKSKSLQLALRGKKYFVLKLDAHEAHKAEEIIESFEEHTKDEILLIHSPVTSWKPRKRVLHANYANLKELVKNSEGMIVAGSALGIIALENEIPLVALDDAIFNFAGLTNQSKLLGFWYRRVCANPSLYGKFKNHIAAKTQINGGFYGKKAIENASKIAAKNMIATSGIAVGNNVSENV